MNIEKGELFDGSGSVGDQSLSGFFRLLNPSFQSTEHNAQKIRVTGYLFWDDDHNGSVDVGSESARHHDRGAALFAA